MKKSIPFALLLLLGVVNNLFSQTTLVEKNKPTAHIILAVDDAESQSAAHILQTFVERIRGQSCSFSYPQ